MSGPYDYRTARPELSSSSPLHGLQAALSSSPPLSPGSPTPAFRRGAFPGARSKSAVQLGSQPDDDDFDDVDDGTTIGDITARSGTLHSPSSSNPHPFSGSSKATLQSHPSFGKGQLRPKHLRNSPRQIPPSLSHDSAGWVLAASSSSGASAAARKGGADHVFAQHFHDSSDDCPSSDDPASLYSLHSRDTTSHSSQSSVQVLRNAKLGLGISDMPEDEDQPSASRSNESLQAAFGGESTATTLAAPKSRARPFSRFQSSSQDPFSAGAGSSVFSPNPTASTQALSPRAHRVSQRRRITGSSPRQLTYAESGQFVNEPGNGFFNGVDESDDDDSFMSNPLRSPRVGKKKAAPDFDWAGKIDAAYEKADGALRLDECNISRMHPCIADLAKFVHVPRHRPDGPRPSMSRVSSLANAGERLASGAMSTSNPSSPTATRTTSSSQGATTGSSSTLSSNVELYLARNTLSILPSALFSVTNIVVLTIRQNGIKELPPAIGQLVNLRELNISQNELTYLPAEMQRLHLTGFVYFPNPFSRPPDGARLQKRRPYGAEGDIPYPAATQESEQAEERQMGSMLPPPVPARSRSQQLLSRQMSFAASGARQDAVYDEASTASSTVDTMWRYLEPKSGQAGSARLPTLSELCIRRLLREPLPADIDEHDSFNLSSAKMLLEGHETDMLSKSRLPLNGKIVTALEAARRSALCAWGRTRPQSSSPWYADLHTVPASSKKQQRHLQALSSAPQNSADEAELPSTPPSAPIDDALGIHFYEEEEGEASGELSSDGNDEASAETGRRQNIDIERTLDEGDNSVHNPWFNRCPNPAHGDRDKIGSGAADPLTLSQDWPHAKKIANGGTHVYAQPCIERMEWVSHVAGFRVGAVSAKDKDLAAKDADGKPLGPLARDSGCLPIRWRGCTLHCLDFLEQS